ncbi:hypothetical protein AN216_05545 [Streptomyces oceani]|uniref:Uncharacterized protein n=1 Tax=Streptomyces oceani TaxID=1075402 RepID=A0A1E7KLM6_9ACTN|nr:DUF1707 domain-containing protein [Streptomyces oceani]OEV04800.1 hypothetical protein AN216_05545 [Streptomyces oceani]
MAPEADVRVSDADRDRVADILREALAAGRLDADEHSERIDAAYAAKTRGELEPLVRDLPEARGESKPSANQRPVGAPAGAGDSGETDNVVAIFSGATRKGRWLVGGRVNAFALFGGVEIDLTEAVFERREVVINVTALFGGVDVRVPENVTLTGSGTGVFGAFEVRPNQADDADAPVVRLRGAAVFGGVDAKPKRGKRLRNLLGG